MNYKLINEPNPHYDAFTQICINRGISIDNIEKYKENDDKYINSCFSFNENLLKEGLTKLIKCINNKENAFVIVDCDVDGFTSAAIIINYLYDLFPTWVINHLTYGFHEGKMHGLPEFIDRLEKGGYGLIICPDSSSNDLKEIERLHNIGTDVLILDHHECDEFSPYATTINSQYDYPNKYLSGAGVVWQFCRYMDIMTGKHYADSYLDLVAYGLQSDMEDIRALETKTLIFKGLQANNIKNPFIDYMLDKNEFALNKSDYKPSANNNLLVTPIGVSFFLTPFGNAICRSGTMEEKELIFNAMLKAKAFEIIPSTKRGHKPGDTETIVTQAVRVCTNVKNRQEREVTAGLELIEKKIKEHNLLENKILLVLLKPGEIAPGIAGLVANKMMAKYQRPCCILTAATEVDEQTNTSHVYYRGSSRGYTKTGLLNFKALCEEFPFTEWARGHANAFGLSIPKEEIENFVVFMNDKLKDLSTDPIYYVDYIWDYSSDKNKVSQSILDISELNDYIGTEFDRPYICFKGVLINQDNFKVMKSNTLKFTVEGIDIIKFDGSDEEIEMFNSEATTKIDIICKCCKNEWMGNVYPQLQAVEYKIVQERGWVF